MRFLQTQLGMVMWEVLGKISIVLGILSFPLTAAPLWIAFRARNAPSGTKVTTTNIVRIVNVGVVRRHPRTPGNPNHQHERSRGQVEGNDDAIAYLVLGVAAAALVSLYYLRYRYEALLAVAGWISVAALVALVAFAIVQRRVVVDARMVGGASLSVLSYIGSVLLLLRIAARNTPYGEYKSLLGEIEREGALATLDRQTFVLYELGALVLVALASLLIALCQLGLMAAVNAALRDRDSWVARRFGPDTARMIWLRPGFGLVLVLMAWVASSEWLHGVLQSTVEVSSETLLSRSS